LRALTTDLAARVRGWTFEMEKWQWQSFITQVEGLLEPEAAEDTGAGAES
jgi:ribosomal protein L20A (L18A)